MSRQDKRLPAALVAVTIMTVILLAGASDNKITETTYSSERLIRLHIVANSDSNEDQTLKKTVREEIIRCVSPEFLQAQDISAARTIAAANLPYIEEIAAREVQAAGKDYSVEVKLGNFLFPTKHYGPFLLPAGDYESVQVVLGDGSGANWWCVLFPPLCFVDMPKQTTIEVPTTENIPAVSSLAAPVDPPLAAAATEAPTDRQNFNGAPETADAPLTYENQPKVEFRFRIWDLLNKLTAGW